MSSSKRANGEGSIYPYRNGFAAYAWVNTPDGKRKRKYVYGNTPLDGPTSDVTAGEEGMERLLSVDDAAEVLGTSARFPRRLIAERRIRFVRVGRHVRIPASALEEFVIAGTVDPVSLRRGAA